MSRRTVHGLGSPKARGLEVNRFIGQSGEAVKALICAASNGGGPPRLQSVRLVAAVAVLGSFINEIFETSPSFVPAGDGVHCDGQSRGGLSGGLQ